MTAPFRLGTRGSRLAMWQARHVTGLLTRAHPGLEVEIVEISTSGDRIQDVKLSGTGGIGFFTKEIEEALLRRRVDVAVHSLKDLPTVLVPGLVLAAVPEREDPRDVIVGRPGRVDSLDDLVAGAVVGTSSPRRRGQLLAAFPEIEVEDLRGNVPTRIGKALAEGRPDAIVLAMAGLSRLGLTEHVTCALEHETMLPAPGQGALGIEVREDDTRARELLAPLEDPAARAAVGAERAFLHRLEGGCTVPAGAFAEVEGGRLLLSGSVADPDGREVHRGAREGSAAEPEEVGTLLAEELLAAGADEILRRLRGEGA